MKTIVITGPSGSGKTFLSKKISKLLKNTITIETDAYYRDNILIKILSLFIYDIYDKYISIKDKELLNTIHSIYKNNKSTTFYTYDFKRRKSNKVTKEITSKNKVEFLILEGIFSHRLNLTYINTINVLCHQEKNICLERRIKRDKLERGRKLGEIKNKFDKSWNLFFKYLIPFQMKNKLIHINTLDEISINKLISILKN